MILEAYRAYRGLSPRQRRLMRSKRISGRYTPAQWLELTQGLALYDRYGDALRRRCGWIAVGGLVAVFLIWLLGSILMDTAGLSVAVVWALEVPLAVLTPLCLAAYLVLRRRDLPNNLRELVVPLIRVLAEDIKPGTPLELHLDLTGGTRKRKLRGEERQNPGRFRYPKVYDRFYLDPWLSGSARLADGSLVKWRVADHIRERRLTRRTARGKVKTKYKHRVKRQLDVILGLREDTYRPVPVGLPKGVSLEVRVKNGRNLLHFGRTIVHRPRTMTPRYEYLDWVLGLDDFLDLIALGYRGAEPVSS